MSKTQRPQFFDDEIFPETGATLVGYAQLIEQYKLAVPAPHYIGIIVSAKALNKIQGRWHIWGSRYQPKAHWFAQLSFALKYEGVDLAVMKALFNALNQNEIVAAIQAENTGAYSRRIWFFYEWLNNTQLPIDNAIMGNYVDAINENFQFASTAKKSARHRVNNNLPGSAGFCPLVRKTDKLTQLIAANLNEQVRINIGRIHKDLLSRAAAFLLLADSKASYNIEGESPSHSRIERWGQIIGQAGSSPLTIDEIERLQAVVIPNDRFIIKGIRARQGFIGMHDRLSNTPIPEHISSKAEDLDELLSDYLDAYELIGNGRYHPVLAATSIAFGFVFMHPLEDGNGRLHRYLLHHVLAETGFTPKGLVFPVSSVILDRMEDYKTVLEQFSKPRLKFIKWHPTADGNVNIVNETADLYRFADFTQHAEFLFECVQTTVTEVLPNEVAYLKAYDEMLNFINSQFDMPQKEVSLMLNFLQQNNGRFSKMAKKQEVKLLSETEINNIEQKYQQVFQLNGEQ